MSIRRWTAPFAVGVALVAGLLAGCASGTDGTGTATTGSATPSGGPTMTTPSTPGPTPSSRPSLPKLSPIPPAPSPGTVILTGQVDFIDIEGGCLVLRAAGQTYQLTGVDREKARPGETVRVHGRIRTDILTICQVGPVLEVIELQPV